MATGPLIYTTLPALVLLLSFQGEKPKALISLPAGKIPIRTWLKKSGWRSLRHDPKRFEVGGGKLHLVSEKDSVMIGTKKGFPVDPGKWPRLRFRIRVDRLPAGMDLSKKKGDDSPFRVYLAFKRGGGLFSPPNTIVYTWTGKLERGRHLRSPHFKRVRYLSVGRGITGKKKGEKGARRPGWITVERNLLEDYRLLFPEDRKGVPPIAGLMLKCDSNDTRTSAEAWLSSLELLPPEKKGIPGGGFPR